LAICEHKEAMFSWIERLNASPHCILEACNNGRQVPLDKFIFIVVGPPQISGDKCDSLLLVQCPLDWHSKILRIDLSTDRDIIAAAAALLSLK